MLSVEMNSRGFGSAIPQICVTLPLTLSKAMTTDEVTCRRCSIIRVNALCRLYDEGFREENDKAIENLKSLVKIAKERGYPDGVNVLFPSLSHDRVRRLCWNISSLLNDQDFLKNGVKLDGR